MTALTIGLVLAAWTVLPFPLAVAVGRSLRAEGAEGAPDRAGDVPAAGAHRPDLTLA